MDFLTCEYSKDFPGKDLMLVKVARTRFCFMVFVFMRLIRLKKFMRVAFVCVTKPAATDEKALDDEPHAKYAKVKDALMDDSFFDQMELFVRVSYPVVLMMRTFVCTQNRFS